MYAISVRHLVVKYQASTVLDDVTVDIAPGEYVALVGPNGSGKTTLIRACLGLVAPSSGQVELFGAPRHAFRDWSRIGYLPQVAKEFDHAFPATVREVVAMGLLPRKRFPKRFTRRDREAVDRVLEWLQIESLATRRIGRLSGGQLQRVFLARAMVGQPELLILDEPTVALDPETRSRFYQTLASLHREGTTVVLITHDSGTVGQYASALLYLDRRVIFFGTFKEFCVSPAMATYFGEFSQHVICHQHG